MSKFTKNDKFVYSIMDVCNAIHGSYSGSGDGLSDEKLQTYVAWLKWRLTSGWDNSSNFNRFNAYEAAVRSLAFASLAEGEKHIQERKLYHFFKDVVDSIDLKELLTEMFCDDYPFIKAKLKND